MFLHGSNAGNGNTGVVAFANYGLILEMPMSLASTGEVIVTILGSKLPAKLPRLPTVLRPIVLSMMTSRTVIPDNGPRKPSMKYG